MARTPYIPPISPGSVPENEEPFEALTEAVETSEAETRRVNAEFEPPPDDLHALHHTEEPRVVAKYDRFMRNERPERESEMLVDDATGWKYQMWNIGMNRDASTGHKKLMKVFMDPIPHVVLDQNVPLRGWYKSKFEPKTVRPRPCFTDSLLTSPYGGYCSVGCNFCYINSGVRGYRGQGVTTVDPSYPDKIAKQLRRMRTGAAVYMSSFIDPFLEVEDYYHNTERTARAAVREGLPIYFLTRKQPPDWAFDLLKLNPYSYMQFSINTSNAEDWRLLSPRAASLETMYANVEAMSKAGIYVSIQVNPIVAGVVSHEDILKLIHDLSDRGAKTLIFKFVEISYPNAPSLVKQVRARFRERADALEALFTQNIGGVKTIDEDYRMEGLNLYARECHKVGVDMSVCYEYVYERTADGKVASKTGVSVGPKYVTSAQCHGHRIPIHSRRETTDAHGNIVPFEPIEECPPSGCLYCAEGSGGEDKVPCGNPLLAKAPAWTAEMLNEPADTIRHGGNPGKFLGKLSVINAPPGGCPQP